MWKVSRYAGGGGYAANSRAQRVRKVVPTVAASRGFFDDAG